MKATVEVKGRRSDSNWINGTVTVDDGSEFRFVAKVYDKPSCFGIETDRFPGGGNISKLNVYRTGDMHDQGESRGNHRRNRRRARENSRWEHGMGETLRQRDVAGSPHSSIRKAGSFFVSARHAARENDERGGT